MLSSVLLHVMISMISIPVQNYKRRIVLNMPLAAVVLHGLWHLQAFGLEVRHVSASRCTNS